MPQRLGVVDAFTDRPFSGNPAAVAILDRPVRASRWPRDDRWMQAVAAEMNLSETAFLAPDPDDPTVWDLRWFTPTIEVDLCGHATLAAAHLLHERGQLAAGAMATFRTRSGPLDAHVHDDGRIELDLPADPSEPCAPPPGLLEALGLAPAVVRDVARGRFDLLVVTSPDDVVGLAPDMAALRAVDTRAVIVCAEGSADGPRVLSRVFAPGSGIDEDPVTGSAHCTLASWFCPRLGLETFTARQCSRRGGTLTVSLRGDRVRIVGAAVTVLDAVLLAE